MRPKTQQIIGLIGLVIGFLGFCYGMYFTFRANVWVASIVTFFGVFCFAIPVFYPMMRNRKEKKLNETGTRARGKIVELWDTGITLNIYSPQIGMMIEVTPATGPAFRSKLTMVISRLEAGNFRVGMDCIVRYDPDNHKKIMIESLGSK